jgi:hypothetical protein
MTYTIPPHRRGDTWDGINSISISINSAPVVLSGAEVKIEFRQSLDAPVAMTFSTSTSTIQILNANTIRILPIKIEVPFAKYYYDLQVTYPNGTVKTYMEGTWEILPDITE